MTCAKKKVKAVLKLRTGEVIVGTNKCDNPQDSCPRVGNDGYTKCLQICRQLFHAEMECVYKGINAGLNLEGGHMQVWHHRICDKCAAEMTQYKITWETME